MAYTGPSISLHVKITVAPENIQKFLDALKPAYDAVVAEPENTLFEVYQDPANPGAFKFVENWNASLEWLRDVSSVNGIFKYRALMTVIGAIKEGILQAVCCGYRTAVG